MKYRKCCRKAFGSGVKVGYAKAKKNIFKFRRSRKK